RHVLGHELRVELGMDHFLDVEVDLLARPRLQLVLQLFDLGALAADDDARTRGENRDPGAIRRPLDIDARDARVIELILDVAPDLDVLVQQVGVSLRREPPGAPRAGRSEAEPDRMRLLTHSRYLSLWRAALRAPGLSAAPAARRSRGARVARDCSPPFS